MLLFAVCRCICQVMLPVPPCVIRRVPPFVIRSTSIRKARKVLAIPSVNINSALWDCQGTFDRVFEAPGAQFPPVAAALLFFIKLSADLLLLPC